MLTVNELFAGIGAFRKALERTGIPFEIIGISEIDKHAIRSYEAIYGKTRNYGDISKVERLDYADLWTYGFPCQDISVAGRGAGIVKGKTRSGLLYEVQRLLAQAEQDSKLPKYLIMENVPNLVSKKFIGDFTGWLDWLDGIGYDNYWQILNAADYGIPQARKRVFCVSIRKDLQKTFAFPAPVPLDRHLSDLLEPAEDVDERYYLSDAALTFMQTKSDEHAARGNGFRFAPVERESNCKSDNDQSRLENHRQLYMGVIVKNCGTSIVRTTEIASTLLARDYKGFGNQEQTGVLTYE